MEKKKTSDFEELDLRGVIAGLLFYAIPTIIYLTFYIIVLIPVPIMIFALKLNADAIKKNPHSYYFLIIFGIITLTFINSISSILIIKDINRQKKEVKENKKEVSFFES